MLIIFIAWFVLSLFMVGVWFYYRATNIPNVVYVAWAIGHWLVGSLYLFAHTMNTRTVVIWLVLTLWALRLSGYLYWTRLRLRVIDQRYLALQHEKTSPALSYFLNYQLQALLIMLTVSSLYFTGQNPSANLAWMDWLAIVVILVAIIFATLADVQLKHFVAAHQGQVCDQGLWRYSRHPNYFFEWLVWVGFALTALATPYGFFALISPLTLYLIMTKITGPMTERGSLQSKPQAYRAYQAKTSMFFPWLSG